MATKTKTAAANRSFTLNLVRSDEKKHSAIFKPAAGEVNPILTGAYLMRPMIGDYRNAKITVEFSN